MLGLLKRFSKLAVSGSLQGPTAGAGVRKISTTKSLHAAEDFKISTLWDDNARNAKLVIESKKGSQIETLLYYEVLKQQLGAKATLETLLAHTPTGVESNTVVMVPVDLETQKSLMKLVGDVVSVPDSLIEEEREVNNRFKKK